MNWLPVLKSGCLRPGRPKGKPKGGPGGPGGHEGPFEVAVVTKGLFDSRLAEVGVEVTLFACIAAAAIAAMPAAKK